MSQNNSQNQQNQSGQQGQNRPDPKRDPQRVVDPIATENEGDASRTNTGTDSGQKTRLNQSGVQEGPQGAETGQSDSPARRSA